MTVELTHREGVARDLLIASRKLAEAAEAWITDRPEDAFGAISDARMLSKAAQDEVVALCERRGFAVSIKNRRRRRR